MLMLPPLTLIAPAGNNVGRQMAVSVAKDGSLQLIVGGEPWLSSDTVWLSSGGNKYCSADFGAAL
jgi:hypothetical protein|eukprot:COSAG01_NODE_132_length_24759_cov_13.862298_21_plen_65_part_00